MWIGISRYVNAFVQIPTIIFLVIIKYILLFIFYIIFFQNQIFYDIINFFYLIETHLKKNLKSFMKMIKIMIILTNLLRNILIVSPNLQIIYFLSRQTIVESKVVLLLWRKLWSFFKTFGQSTSPTSPFHIQKNLGKS